MQILDALAPAQALLQHLGQREAALKILGNPKLSQIGDLLRRWIGAVNAQVARLADLLGGGRKTRAPKRPVGILLQHGQEGFPGLGLHLFGHPAQRRAKDGHLVLEIGTVQVLHQLGVGFTLKVFVQQRQSGSAKELGALVGGQLLAGRTEGAQTIPVLGIGQLRQLRQSFHALAVGLPKNLLQQRNHRGLGALLAHVNGALQHRLGLGSERLLGQSQFLHQLDAFLKRHAGLGLGQGQQPILLLFGSLRSQKLATFLQSRVFVEFGQSRMRQAGVQFKTSQHGRTGVGARHCLVEAKLVGLHGVVLRGKLIGVESSKGQALVFGLNLFPRIQGQVSCVTG